jgi:hypothetical protein
MVLIVVVVVVLLYDCVIVIVIGDVVDAKISISSYKIKQSPHGTLLVTSNHFVRQHNKTKK